MYNVSGNNEHTVFIKHWIKKFLYFKIIFFFSIVLPSSSVSPETNKKEVSYALIKPLEEIYKFIYNVSIKVFWVQNTMKRNIESQSWTCKYICTPIQQAAS